MPDDDDRPRDAAGAADATWAEVVVPDDISELAPEIEAYHRELRTARRQARWRWLTGHRLTMRALVTVAVVAIMAATAVVLTVTTPKSQRTDPTPLTGLSSVSGLPPAGSVNGPIPDVVFQNSAGTSVASSTLPPVVYALLKLPCKCDQLLTGLATEARQGGYDLIVVSSVAKLDSAEADALAGRFGHGTTVLFPTSDTKDLYKAVGATGAVTVVTMNSNRTIYAIHKSVSDASEITPDLQRLAHSG